MPQWQCNEHIMHPFGIPQAGFKIGVHHPYIVVLFQHQMHAVTWFLANGFAQGCIDRQDILAFAHGHKSDLCEGGSVHSALSTK